MVLVRTYVIPHGDEVISLPNPESRLMNRAISKVTKNDPSETLLIISPHSLSLPNGLPVINTKYVSGMYKIGKITIKGEYETDRELNSRLVEKSKHFVRTNFVTSEGKLSTFPVDFGTLIPLKFFGKKKISMLGQWRTSRRSELISLGKKMFEAVSDSERKISVVFSADQAHTHSKSGPYGYDSRAKLYDKMMVKALESNRFEKIIALNDVFINGAKPDSYWNLLMFHGFATCGGLLPKFHYYYLQEYFGMLLATAE